MPGDGWAAGNEMLFCKEKKRAMIIKHFLCYFLQFPFPAAPLASIQMPSLTNQRVLSAASCGSSQTSPDPAASSRGRGRKFARVFNTVLRTVLP